MLGKKYRRIENGRIYEIIGQDVDFELSCLWLLWNGEFGDPRAATEAELVKQVGWDFVGKEEKSDPQNFPAYETPSTVVQLFK